MRLIFVLSVLPLLPLSISTHLIQPPAFSLSTDKKHFRSIFIPLFEGWQRSTTRTDQVGGNKISNFNWSFANFQRSNTMTPKEAALAGRGGLTRFKWVHLLSKNVYDLHKVEAASLIGIENAPHCNALVNRSSTLLEMEVKRRVCLPCTTQLDLMTRQDLSKRMKLRIQFFSS